MTTEYSGSFFLGQREGSLKSAEVVVPLIMEMLHPLSVVDIGCGMGGWLAEFSRYGAEIMGIDGDYCKTLHPYISLSDYYFCDIEQCALMHRSIPGLERHFDLAICLEVAEHLDSRCSKGLIELITNLADHVMFSAAIPFQGGSHHVNEQWLSYWIELFKEFDYYPIDIIRPLIWNNADVKVWYRQNIMFYCKREHAEQYKKIAKNIDNVENYLSKVHPDFYLMCVEYYKSLDYFMSIPNETLLKVLKERVASMIRRKISSILSKYPTTDTDTANREP